MKIEGKLAFEQNMNVGNEENRDVQWWLRRSNRKITIGFYKNSISGYNDSFLLGTAPANLMPRWTLLETPNAVLDFNFGLSSRLKCSGCDNIVVIGDDCLELYTSPLWLFGLTFKIYFSLTSRLGRRCDQVKHLLSPTDILLISYHILFKPLIQENFLQILNHQLHSKWSGLLAPVYFATTRQVLPQLHLTNSSKLGTLLLKLTLNLTFQDRTLPT